MTYSLPKGTFDILPNQPEPWRCIEKWHHIERTIRMISHLYNYKEIRTPIFERTELFVRGVGSTSDIVSKEMYTFEDKGGRSMTLRPEGTASVIRAYIEKSLHMTPFQKLFYIGPFFRYDRPQAGRFRQFHQVGVEFFGEADPFADYEVITLALALYEALGLKHLKLMLNSVGTEHSRIPYRNALREFLLPHKDTLSEDSKQRLEKNPLRILDSKDPNDQKLLDGAPQMGDFLDEASRTHFEKLCSLLEQANVPFTVEPRLVRGLDYYNKTVFEIASDVLGAQNVLGGGGRYDGFLQQFNGPDIPGIGFATGIERILVTMEGQGAPFPRDRGPFIYLIPLGETAERISQKLLHDLRQTHIPADVHRGSKKVQKGLQTAELLGATYALVLGDNEIESKQASLKDVTKREEIPISLTSFIETLQPMWKQHAQL